MLSVKLICLLLLTGCACVTFAQPCQTPWKDCGSTGMKINNVVVPGCCSNPCQMIKGKNSTITVTFTPSSDYSDLTQKLCAIMGSVCLPAPFKFPSDVCTLVTGCPFGSGKQYSETVTLFVSPDFPDVKAVAKWTYYGPDNKMVGCFEVPLAVSSSKSTVK